MRHEVERRIDGPSLDADLEMHVVGGGASRAPHGRDDLSLPYPLPLPDLKLQTMGVQGGEPAAMIEEHHVSIPSEPSGFGGYDLFDHPVLYGPDGGPPH